MIKNFLKLFYAFSLIAVFVVCTAYAVEQESTSQLFNEAEIYFMNGQYQKSITIFDQILETAPDSKIIFLVNPELIHWKITSNSYRNC